MQRRWRWVPRAVTTAAGKSAVDIHGLVGSYKFRVTYTNSSGTPTALGGGTFTAQAGSTPTFVTTTQGSSPASSPHRRR